MTNRYPGSRPFEDTAVDRILFNARDYESKLLFHYIYTEPLVVLFAKSGIGKSSLLKASIFQALRDNGMFPIPIELKLNKTDIVEHIYSATKALFQFSETKSNSFLADFFHQTEFRNPEGKRVMPIIVFDQFEDYFIRNHKKASQEKFFKQFVELIGRSKETNFMRVVISLREDFLGKLDEFRPYIPSILSKRIWLKPLTRAQAEDAIVKPAALNDERLVSPRFQYASDALKEMLDFLCGKESNDEVEPFQLQILCRYCENLVIEQKRNVVNQSDLGGISGMNNIIQNYYENQMQNIDSQFRKKCRILIEENLIINEQRIPIDERTVISKHQLPRPAINQLIDCRLVRREERGDGSLIEITHDSLIEPILKSSEIRIQEKEGKKHFFTQILYLTPFISTFWLLLLSYGKIIGTITKLFNSPIKMPIIIIILFCVPILIVLCILSWSNISFIKKNVKRKYVRTFQFLSSIILLFVLYNILWLFFQTDVKIESERIIKKIIVNRKSSYLPFVAQKESYQFALEINKKADAFVFSYNAKQDSQKIDIILPWGNYEIRYYNADDTTVFIRLPWNFRSFQQTLLLL